MPVKVCTATEPPPPNITAASGRQQPSSPWLYSNLFVPITIFSTVFRILDLLKVRTDFLAFTSSPWASLLERVLVHETRRQNLPSNLFMELPALKDLPLFSVGPRSQSSRDNLEFGLILCNAPPEHKGSQGINSPTVHLFIKGAHHNVPVVFALVIVARSHFLERVHVPPIQGYSPEISPSLHPPIGVLAGPTEYISRRVRGLEGSK